MKQKLLILFSFFLVSSELWSQCVLVPFSLQKKTYDSDVVIEGRILSSSSFWNAEHTFIYTSHKVQIGKILKGSDLLSGFSELVVITEGGQVGFDALKVEPALELQSGEVGVLFLRNSEIRPLNCSDCDLPRFIGMASEQSFIKYDEETLKGHGYFEVYNAIGADLLPKIQSYSNEEIKEVDDLKIGFQGIKPLAAPVISTMTADSVSAGTATLLTITGSNFGIIRGNGKVEFVDPNYGDGRYFEIPYPSSYKSWSNSKIEVYVPTRAGTGKIRVTNNSAESSTSSSNLYVKYTHSNVGYSGTTGIDSGYYQVNHKNDNSKGGYTWQCNKKFAAKPEAVNAFLRAAENWRCQTLMNWDLGNDTTVDQITRDNVNVVRFTKFTDGRLGVCYSWYSGCFNSSNVFWYVAELDIEFDSSRNWNYTTNAPGKSQYDFETVATHELGHGQQLSHVIDPTKIMHYALGAGDRNVILSKYDIEGGEYVREKSKLGDPCGPSTYYAIKPEDCNITKPKSIIAASDTLTCPGKEITLTNSSEGKVKSINWSFGTDASQSSSTLSGPHTISYSSSGTKTVQLIVSNDFGSDTSFRSIVILPDTPSAPGMFVFDDTACIGISRYQIASVENATRYKWTVGAGGEIPGVSTDTVVDVSWTNAGSANELSVVAANSCGTSDPATALIEVIPVAVASYTEVNESLTVQFTSDSKSASKYEWDFGDGEKSSEENPSHKFPTRGVYTVVLHVSNHCSDSSISKNLSVDYGAGISSVSETILKVYPNPNNGIVKITTKKTGTITFSDVTGTVVKSDKVDGVSEVDVTNFSTGVIYWIFVSEDGVFESGRLTLIR
ncbi:MAG: PKD domain-containing protein [Bacteroidetes bacterium]|nr:PKD domain-containing protein [Bacteroidota bacterium]